MPTTITVAPGRTIELLEGDITRQRVDAIVNAANSSLMGGGGVDGAIHRAGGPAILAECRKIRETKLPDGLPAGEAVATTAGNLPAKYVIHTVGPVWHGGTHGEAERLASCYRESLRVADDLQLESVAFPAISTGVYGYPMAAAAEIAVSTVTSALAQARTVRRVLFVLFGSPAYRAFETAAAAVNPKR